MTLMFFLFFALSETVGCMKEGGIDGWMHRIWGCLASLHCLNLLGSWNSLIGSVVELYKRGASIVSCFIVSNTKIIIISSLPSIFCCFATCHDHAM